MDTVLRILLLLGPPLAALAFIAFWRRLSWFKTVCLAAVFIGASLAYAHFHGAGLYGLVLALAGLVFYIEELRLELYRDMERLANEENWEYLGSEESKKK
jgi:hypothetical protein